MNRYDSDARRTGDRLAIVIGLAVLVALAILVGVAIAEAFGELATTIEGVRP